MRVFLLVAILFFSSFSSKTKNGKILIHRGSRYATTIFRINCDEFEENFSHDTLISDDKSLKQLLEKFLLGLKKIEGYHVDVRCKIYFYKNGVKNVLCLGSTDIVSLNGVVYELSSFEFVDKVYALK